MYIYMYTYRKFGLNKPFLLCVGKRYGYKNYEILWQGLALMPKTFRGTWIFKSTLKEKGLKKKKKIGKGLKKKKTLPTKPSGVKKEIENERKRPHAPY